METAQIFKAQKPRVTYPWIKACTCALAALLCIYAAGSLGQKEIGMRAPSVITRPQMAPMRPHTGCLSRMQNAFRVGMQPRSSIEDENREAYKQVITEYLKDGVTSESVGAWKNDINEMLFRLEPLNPTPEPAYSKLLQGDWEFKFIGSMAKGVLESPTREIALLLYAGGYTPGRFGFDVVNRLPKNVIDISSLKLSVTERSPTGKVSAGLKLPGDREVEIALSTNLEPESDFTMSETYQGLSVMGRSFDLPAQLQSKRRFYVRYLDQDLLVVRDDTGVADVLVRKTVEATPIEPVTAAEANSSTAASGEMMTFDSVEDKADD
mmetsp:Transcript_25621/g.35675  ORF Transcript_25621/g.35675 Transcript_25621/m.35675 type:complete len:323 (-) Transcript_25621:218-1186(-)|eukprot:CAMPEP_0184484264 /NCGR_PEP_ID=MMETSP0113_2-20130426/5988_1 /TAXON_ID=91329 /ORGANISM="Norrisiella sphaerica, Strain BC52" /LENGTH=322 /DNA_ID=CAMNT_0026865185 /DNA_START=155 /DNA_END=1123 /DNA_ORIENTATION=+